MSTSGESLTVSLRTHTASRRKPAASSASVLPASQCHVGLSLTATSTAPRPADINAAPVQLTRPGTRTGDSGTNRWTATVVATMGISGS